MANPEVLRASVPAARPRGQPDVLGRDRAAARGDGAVCDAKGVVDRREFVGLWATSVQHRIDHLNGRMYFHLSR